MILKITPSVDFNLWLKRLYTQLNEPTNKYTLKVPKVVKPTNKKTLFKTLVTSVINSPMSTLFLIISLLTIYFIKGAKLYYKLQLLSVFLFGISCYFISSLVAFFIRRKNLTMYILTLNYTYI